MSEPRSDAPESSPREPNRLEAYHDALRLLASVHSLLATLPPGHGSLAARLRKTSAAVVTSLAESAAESSPVERTRLDHAARRASAECAAALDIARQIAKRSAGGARLPEIFDRARTRAERVARVLAWWDPSA